MYSKISYSGCRLKLFNSKSGYKHAVLHLIIAQLKTRWRSADESTCALELLVLFLTSVICLKPNGAYTAKIDHLYINSLWTVPHEHFSKTRWSRQRNSWCSLSSQPHTIKDVNLHFPLIASSRAPTLERSELARRTHAWTCSYLHWPWIKEHEPSLLSAQHFQVVRCV